MTFHVAVTGVDELADQQLLTDVQIDRRLYGHSSASAGIHWPDTEGYPDRTAALLAGKALNCPVEITWKDNDLGEATPCFRGYVEAASAERLPSSSVLHLSCASYTKRTDLVPRFRAFQATTLHDIAQQIAQAEPLIKIVSPGDLQIPIALSLQHGETNFAFLSRMLRAWGVPMATEDRTGRVLLGARGQEPPIPFPDADWGWSHLAFDGALQALPSLVPGGGSGAAGLARQALGRFLGQMTTKAAGYHFTPDQAQLSQTHAQMASQTGTSRAEMQIDGSVLPFAPGHVVEVEGVSHLINAVSIRGRANEGTVSQTFSLQQPTLPVTAPPAPPSWMLHPVWAYVTDNASDPEQQGRIQVEFETEPLDPQPSHERMWLHTLTPYGGGIGPGGARLLPTPHGPRAHAYSAGFYSLPEVGERVLVQFLGQWDSDAVVLGTVRHGAVTPKDNARDTKRWRTPSGNEVAMTTEGEGTDAKDVLSLHVRNHVVLQAHVSHGSEDVFLMCGSSYVHLTNKEGQAHVEVTSAGSLLVHAAGHLQLEGDSVQILAKGGKVSVKDTAMGGRGSGFVGRKTLNKNLDGKTKPSKRGAKFTCAMKYLSRAEAGYTVDSGGPTMHGITQHEYIPYRNLHHPNDPAWPDLSQHPEDMKRLTEDHALEIYQHDYWDSSFEKLPMPLALCCFDAKVQSSSYDTRAATAQSLGLSKEASWGQVQATANQANPAQVSAGVQNFLQARLDRYVGLATGRRKAKFHRYMQGWANRIGLPNPLASAEADRRSKQGYGDGLKQFIEKLDKHCPGCK